MIILIDNNDDDNNNNNDNKKEGSRGTKGKERKETEAQKINY